MNNFFINNNSANSQIIADMTLMFADLSQIFANYLRLLAVICVLSAVISVTMKKFFIISFLIFFSIFLSGCQKQGQEITNAVTGLGAIDKKIQADKDLAVAQAKELYRQAATDDLDLTNGPCLSNNLMPDWVADIAHNPRQSIDDQPENQCSAFREGKAHHFVELDLEGNVIKVY